MLARPAVPKTDYPMRIVILSERSEPKDPSSPAASPLPVHPLAARHIRCCDKNPAPATPLRSPSSSPHRCRDAHKSFRIRSYTNCRGSRGINRNLLQKRSTNRKSPNSPLLFRLYPTSASPLEATLTSHAQLIENTTTLSSLDATLTRFGALTPLEATLQKRGE